MYGWMFWIGNNTYFIESDRKNKTKGFVRIILRRIFGDFTESDVENIFERLQKGCCEIKKTSHGRTYYDIYGHGYGSSEFADEGTTFLYSI